MVIISLKLFVSFFFLIRLMERIICNCEVEGIMKLIKKFIYVVTFVLFNLVVISGCGGGSGGGDGDKKPNADNPPITNPPIVESPIPESPIPDIPESLPPETSEPAESNPLPPVKTSDITPITLLTVAGITAQNDGDGNLTVNWSGENSANYRVIFWTISGEAHEIKSSITSAVIPASVRDSGGEFVIESINAQGNSVFSAPITVGAI